MAAQDKLAKTRVYTKQSKPLLQCLKCGAEKQQDEFYANRGWFARAGRDGWCKTCVGKCTDKGAMREYFWENHREWSEALWDNSLKKAKRILANNDIFKKSSDARRDTLIQRLTAQQIPQLMASYYNYIDTGDLTYKQALQKGQAVEADDPNSRRWSQEWDGNFTGKELEYLQGYYKKLQDDFNFSDASMRDYAKKVCRASMQVNKTMDDFAAGRCDYTAVKDAVSVFDMLSKSANFAACKRKQGDTGNITSWAETVYELQTNGHTMQTQIKWPQDDVDRVIKNLQHIAACLGLDSN